MAAQAHAFRYNRRLLKVALPLTALALAVGLYLTYSEWPDGPDLLEGVLVVVVAAAFLVWLASPWSDRGVIVAVGPDGVYDRRLCNAPIPWDAITAIRSYDVWDSRLLRWLGIAGGVHGSSNRFAGIIVVNPDAYFRPNNPVVRALVRLNSRITGYPLLSVNMRPLDGALDDFLAAVRRYAPAEQVKIEE